MLSLSKIVPSLANAAFKNSARTFYPASYFGITNFQAYTERFRTENSQNANIIKAAVKDSLSKPDAKIFTEDLKSYLYHVTTDEELDTLINAIKKLRNQSQLTLFTFTFEGPLMRLLYTLDKTNKALELYLSDEPFSKSFNVTAMLMNKLIAEGRYDDTIKVWDHFFPKVKSLINASSATTATTETTDANKKNQIPNHIKLYTEALLKKHGAESFERAKSCLKELKEAGLSIPGRSIMHVVLMALENKQPDLARELIDQIFNKQDEIKTNLKILAFIEAGQIDDAVRLAGELNKKGAGVSDVTGMRKKYLFFETTLKKLSDAVEKDEEKKKQVEAIINGVKSNGNIFNPDLYDWVCRGEAFRKDQLKNQQRLGGGGGFGGGGGQGFNRGGDRQQQGFGGKQQQRRNFAPLGQQQWRQNNPNPNPRLQQNQQQTRTQQQTQK